ncbi:Hypothetical protein PACV_298 [Pacmanvirus A23]|uniref:Hypothetical protein n=1 Tax=Pacmanvirus A23 TaxID=1932881 RepID=UPI000A094350|nr:Hypothetical protein B9W72_gp294 [Pacmanvirus A23]SIP86011.1 Hypothetical protein PACV_298 [Pacmanvirus A23]
MPKISNIYTWVQVLTFAYILIGYKRQLSRIWHSGIIHRCVFNLRKKIGWFLIPKQKKQELERKPISSETQYMNAMFNYFKDDILENPYIAHNYQYADTSAMNFSEENLRHYLLYASKVKVD